MLCMVVLLFAMTTGVMGYYQKDRDPIEDPTGTSEVETTPIPTVNRQTELADAKRKNPDAMAWLYIPGAEVDDLVMQAGDNGYYLKLDENGEYAIWGCYYAHCENNLSSRDALDKNTTIFGHSASNCDPDGPKFTKLYRYTDADFVKEYPYIYLSVDGDDLIFQITALFVTDIAFDYTEKRNCYQKVIICFASLFSLPIAAQILRCRRRSSLVTAVRFLNGQEALSIVYSDAKYTRFPPKIAAAQKSLF